MKHFQAFLAKGFPVRLRLLERIRFAHHGLNALDYNNSDALVDSLAKHLSLILNTHQGSSVSAPDYGIPDFASLTSLTDLESVRELARILTEVVRKYEPRLKNAVVTHSAGNQETGVLEFSLNGQVELNDEVRNIFFATAITPDGKITVNK
ncbi:MAG: type VI secretion system baseplate subunit TssE [Deltaproteobacteria bacterium]|jgi:type VI secretion system protein|nr:type VI secretion system baseplate subunit TssE [Deltaproteobacteria bacterium]